MNGKDKTSDIMSSMTERHKNILEILQLQGSISVTDLSERLNVSEVTIRKDLTALETQNKLYRTHGKAMRPGPGKRRKTTPGLSEQAFAGSTRRQGSGRQSLPAETAPEQGKEDHDMRQDQGSRRFTEWVLKHGADIFMYSMIVLFLAELTFFFFFTLILYRLFLIFY